MINEVDHRYALPHDAAADLEKNGFSRLPGVLSPEMVNRVAPEITSKVIELNTMHLPLEERDTYSKAFLQVGNLWQHSETVRELVFSRELARIAAELLEVDGVRLYFDQALYKEAGGGITPWHADQYYWPFESDRVLTVWIPLQDTPLELGPLEFAEGSHKVEFGRDLQISDDSERKLQAQLTEQGYATNRQPYQIGDVSYHLGWTFHRAGRNTSTIPRGVQTIVYMDADIRVAEPKNESQRGDLASWMPGVQVGEVPDSPLNPVLYRRSEDTAL